MLFVYPVLVAIYKNLIGVGLYLALCNGELYCILGINSLAGIGGIQW